jgi:hypothetical protein
LLGMHEARTESESHRTALRASRRRGPANRVLKCTPECIPKFSPK